MSLTWTSKLVSSHDGLDLAVRTSSQVNFLVCPTALFEKIIRVCSFCTPEIARTRQSDEFDSTGWQLSECYHCARTIPSWDPVVNFDTGYSLFESWFTDEGYLNPLTAEILLPVLYSEAKDFYEQNPPLP